MRAAELSILEWWAGLLCCLPSWSECRSLTEGAIRDELWNLLDAIRWYLDPLAR